MREQVRTATVIVRIFANRILERLADAQNAIRFYKRKTVLVVAILFTTPKISGPILERLPQIPVIDFPNGNTTCRERRIKAAHAKNQALRLLCIALALAFGANTVLKHEMQAIDRNQN